MTGTFMQIKKFFASLVPKKKQAGRRRRRATSDDVEERSASCRSRTSRSSNPVVQEPRDRADREVHGDDVSPGRSATPHGPRARRWQRPATHRAPPQAAAAAATPAGREGAGRAIAIDKGDKRDRNAAGVDEAKTPRRRRSALDEGRPVMRRHPCSRVCCSRPAAATTAAATRQPTTRRRQCPGPKPPPAHGEAEPRRTSKIASRARRPRSRPARVQDRRADVRRRPLLPAGDGKAARLRAVPGARHDPPRVQGSRLRRRAVARPVPVVRHRASTGFGQPTEAKPRSRQDRARAPSSSSRPNYSYEDLKLVGIVAQGTQRKVLMMDPATSATSSSAATASAKRRRSSKDIGTGFVTFVVAPENDGKVQRPADERSRPALSERPAADDADVAAAAGRPAVLRRRP